MKRLGFLLIVAAAALTLVGCHSASPSASEPANPPSASSTPEPVRVPASAPAAPLDTDTKNPQKGSQKLDARSLIVCFGDSLTAGYGTEDGQSYPDYLQADLDSAGYNYRVLNAGISGNTTKDAVNRLDHIVSLKPALVIVEFGGNDGLRGLPIQDTRANLDKVVSTLKATGAKVVLAGITLPPNYGPDYIQQFNQTYELLATKYRVPMLPFLLKGVFGVPGMMQADQTHATAAGNQIVARNLLPLITPLLAQQQQSGIHPRSVPCN
jgi:acyl-CoA thioesterase I